MTAKNQAFGSYPAEEFKAPSDENSVVNIMENHMPLQQCIDILEWSIGDKEDIPAEWQTGAHVVQATRIAIEASKEKLFLIESWNKIEKAAGIPKIDVETNGFRSRYD